MKSPALPSARCSIGSFMFNRNFSLNNTCCPLNSRSNPSRPLPSTRANTQKNVREAGRAKSPATPGGVAGDSANTCWLGGRAIGDTARRADLGEFVLG